LVRAGAADRAGQRHITIYETLKRIGDAETRALDVWSVSITCGARGPCQR